MTDEIGWAELGVRPDATGFGSSLTQRIGPEMDSSSRSAGSRFSAGFKKAFAVGAVGLAGAAGLAVKFAADALGEAREAQKVGAQTEAVIRSTGGAARVTSKDVGRLSTHLSNMAGIDDELIQSGANVILTFKNIRNEAGKGNDIFKRATKTALDMSTALGTDLKGASIQVGKALNDPVKGITALQRVGVTFTNQQRAQIKALVEGGDANAAMALNLIQTSTEWSTLLKANGGDSQKVAAILTNDLTPAQKKLYDTYAEGGHTLDAQKRILRELSSEFGGSAKAQATASDKLKVAFGNLKEEIGNELLPYMDDLATLIRKEGIPAARDFFHWFEDTGVPVLKKVGGFLKSAGGHAKDLIGFLKELPDPAKYAGLIALVGGVGAAKLRGGKGGALGTAGSLLGLTKPIPVLVTNPGFGAGGGSPIVAGGGGGAGKLPGWAPFIPVGIGGKNDIGGGRTPLALPPEVKQRIDDLTHSYDNFGEHAMGAFHGVDKAIINSTDHLKQYQRVLGATPRQVQTLVGISGYERAIGQIRTLQAGIDALAGRGTDNGVPFLHGGTRSSGVNVTIGTVHVKDGRDLLNKSQQAALGGRRTP